MVGIFVLPAITARSLLGPASASACHYIVIDIASCGRFEVWG